MKFFKVLFSFLVIGGAVGSVIYYLEIQPKYLELSYKEFGLSEGSKILKGEDFVVGEKLDSDNKFDQTLFKEAIHLSQLNQNAKANDMFYGLLEKYPDDFSLLFHTVLNILEGQQWDDDISSQVSGYLSNANEIKKNHPALHFLEGKFLKRIGNLTGARFSFQQAIELAPHYPKPYLELSKIARDNGELLDALKKIHFAIELEDFSQEKNYSLIAYLYHDLGILDSCKQVLDYSLVRFPYNPDLNLLRGYLHEYDDDLELAKEQYLKIMSINPNFIDASLAYKSLGNKQKPKLRVRYPTPTVAYVPNEELEEYIKKLKEQYYSNDEVLHVLNKIQKKITGRDEETVVRKENDKRSRFADEIDFEQPDVSASTLILKEKIEEQYQRSKDNSQVRKKEKWEQFGHYLVTWGASEQEFFSKYPKSQFAKVRKGVYKESFSVGNATHEYFVRFNNQGLWGINVYVTDSLSGNRDLYVHSLNNLTKISGIGQNIGKTICEDSIELAVSLWQTTDNYEVLVQELKDRDKVSMMRLSPKYLPDSEKLLCSVIPLLKDFKKV